MHQCWSFQEKGGGVGQGVRGSIPPWAGDDADAVDDADEHAHEDF